ncbi:three-helix bundle dimerization domain-containing protein [Gordonia sp. NPDC058843]|uniref:three-helix bundle dimerization domain-containing protein n=1 Tax=Gordonia sp. NPDC058843 TaxID=3346648 RepID=UPI003676D47B
MDANDERRQVTEVQHRLIGMYTDKKPEDVAEAVEAAYRHFDGIDVRDFVPLLVERRANQALSGSAVMADSGEVPPALGG